MSVNFQVHAQAFTKSHRRLLIDLKFALDVYRHPLLQSRDVPNVVGQTRRASNETTRSSFGTSNPSFTRQSRSLRGCDTHVPVNDQKHNLEAKNIRLMVAESFPLTFDGAVCQQITDSILAGRKRSDRLPPITSSTTSWTTNIPHTTNDES